MSRTRTPLRIAVVIGSTRPGRRGAAVARWVHETAGRHPAVVAGDAAVEVVDVAAYGLPILDEAVPAAIGGGYGNAHTARWSETIGSYDGFVFVTPEYNHSVPGALKNAIDFLFGEWHDKAAGFVSYGVHGGVRAVEHLRHTLAEVKVAGVRTQVALSVFDDFAITDPAETGEFTPGEHHEPTLAELLGEVIAWSGALRTVRVPGSAAVAA